MKSQLENEIRNYRNTIIELNILLENTKENLTLEISKKEKYKK